MSTTSSPQTAARHEDPPEAGRAPSRRAPAVRRRWPSWLTEQRVIATTAVIAALVAWELVALARVKPALILPGPTDVIGA